MHRPPLALQARKSAALLSEIYQLFKSQDETPQNANTGPESGGQRKVIGLERNGSGLVSVSQALFVGEVPLQVAARHVQSPPHPQPPPGRVRGEGAWGIRRWRRQVPEFVSDSGRREATGRVVEEKRGRGVSIYYRDARFFGHVGVKGADKDPTTATAGGASAEAACVDIDAWKACVQVWGEEAAASCWSPHAHRHSFPLHSSLSPLSPVASHDIS